MSAVAATAGVTQTTTATGNNATGGPSTSNSARVLRTGTLYVRERGAFGKAWKSKGVELDEKHLTIHQSSSGRHIRLPLGSITELERTDLMSHSLSIKCAGKVYHIAFDSDGDLYDWQDDMYSRSRLGAQTTSPFDFKHTAHLGSGGASGTFADSTLPLYEEMIGRSAPAVIEGSTAASPVIASRTRSSTSTAARRRSNPPLLRANVALNNNNNNANIEGVYFIKQSGGVFAGWYWKERWLSLKGNSLTVHTRKTKASPPAKEIPLSTIKSVEPDPKRRNSLVVSTSSRETCISILFDTDNDLYAWREAIYLRSAMSAVISPPTDFVHAMHVTYDESTGQLKGLPDQWKSVLYPAGHSAHIVSLPIQSNSNANGTSRSSRRRSQPAPGKLEASRMSPNSSALFANMSRVPPPLSSSADTQSTGFAGTPMSQDSRFLGGTSAGSDGTLFSVSPQNPAMMSMPKEAS